MQRSHVMVSVTALLLMATLAGCDLLGFGDSTDTTTTGTGSTTDTSGTTGTPAGTPIPGATAPRAIWGTWVRMDNGTRHYFGDRGLKIGTSTTQVNYTQTTTRSVTTADATYQLATDNVMTSGTTRFFREGGATRSFSVMVAGFTDTMARTMTLPGQATAARPRRNNPNNSADTQETTVSAAGVAEFTQAVAGDVQEVEVAYVAPSGPATVTVEVTPQYDDEFVGTIPLVESGHNFKTTYTVQADQMINGYLYANAFDSYNVSINLQNIGDNDALTSLWQLTMPEGLTCRTALEGNLSSIAPTTARSIHMNVVPRAITGEYEDFRVTVRITDTGTQRTWEDYISLRFYRLPVTFQFRAFNIDGNRTAKLKGFVVTPDQRSVFFEVAHDQVHTMILPYRSQPYLLAFSGAGHTSEMKYSFAVGGAAPTQVDNSTWSLEQIMRYGAYNSETNPFVVPDPGVPTDGYLQVNTINFFRINMTQFADRQFQAIVYNDHQVAERTWQDGVGAGNGDGIVNPGENIALDMRIQNVSRSSKNLEATISSTSPYVTIVQPTGRFGTIEAGRYQTLYQATRGGGASTSATQTLSAATANSPFVFSVAANAPPDAAIDFTFTFREALGHSWAFNGSLMVRASTLYSGVTAVAAGENHSLILKTDGSLWSTGANNYLQLGDRTTTARSVPAPVLSDVRGDDGSYLPMTGVASVVAGNHHAMIVKSDGSLWGLGYNNHGQVGNGTSNNSVAVQVLTGVASVAAGGNHSLILKTDGTLWATGRNYYGQLGNGATADRYVPVQIMSDVATMAAGGDHSLIVKTDGTLWAAGYNYRGQLGDGTTTNRSTPVQVMSGVAAVAAGNNHSLILKTDGTLWATGYSGEGQLGNGTTSRSTPVQVLTDVAKIAAGNHSLAVKTDGGLWSTGYNNRGQLGQNSTTTMTHWYQVYADANRSQAVTDVTAISAGNQHSLIVAGGGLYAAGNNGSGQLGDGTTTSRSLLSRIWGASIVPATTNE